MFEPQYHFYNKKGWSNDPNGLIVYKGKIHIFYQYYPHDTSWGIMHWGHVVTTDMIHFEEYPIALYPDKDYEETYGCFSGSTIVVNERLYLMYTCANTKYQAQCLAYSDDGIHFHKCVENPVISPDTLPECASHIHFRDPKIFLKDNYYCVIGGQYEGYGNIFLYESHNLIDWNYRGVLFHNLPDHLLKMREGIYECPDYFSMNEKDIIITSPQGLKSEKYNYQNIHSVIALIGHLDRNIPDYQLESHQELDYGFDFYAPQTFEYKGRRILIGWKEMWHRNYPTKNYGWIGSYTLLRELTLKDGHLYQYPVKEVNDQFELETDTSFLLEKETLYKESFNCGKITLTFKEPGGIKLFYSKNEETVISFDKTNHTVLFDRSHSGHFEGRDNDLYKRYCVIEEEEARLTIYIDISCIEVYINEGKYVMTGNVYSESKGILLYTDKPQDIHILTHTLKNLK